MSTIPEEIYFEIFLRVVEVRSVLACKCVCKTWFDIISHPDFIKKHLNLTIKRDKPNLMLQVSENCTPTCRYEFYSDECLPSCRNVFYSIRHDSLESSLSSTDIFLDYAVELDYPFKSLSYSVEVMGCCDGLVCLWFQERWLFCLWNPATGEYKVLPNKIFDRLIMVGFGYDYMSSDYKLLFGSINSSKVYSLRLNSWKNIENLPDDEFLVCHECGVLVNGNLHWLAERKKQGFTYALVSLDISNEIFKEIELPEESLANDQLCFSLGVSEGCLHLLSSPELGDGHVTIWVMQNYGVQESWTKRYTVKNKRVVDDTSLRLLWSFKSGEILFRDDQAGIRDQAGLLIYDPESERVTEPNVSRLTFFKEELYFESLVSLNSSTYVGVEEEIE